MNVPIRLNTFPTLLDVLNRCLLVVTITLLYLCDEYSLHEDRLENYLLCKYCGADVADLEYSVDIHSPASVQSENHNFSGKVVLLQTLKNPSGIHFDVVTVKKGNCIGVGEWKKADTWFPGFAWKVCVCQPWGHFLGWIFEPFDSLQENQKKASDKGVTKPMEKNKQAMSSSEIIVPSMTEEQENLLKDLEEIFKDRYTEDDEGFRETFHRQLPPPPVIENWIRPHDSRHWRRDNGHEDRGSYRQRFSYGNYESYRGYKRDDDDDYYERGGRRGRYSYPHNRHRYEPY